MLHKTRKEEQTDTLFYNSQVFIFKNFITFSNDLNVSMTKLSVDLNISIYIFFNRASNVVQNMWQDIYHLNNLLQLILHTDHLEFVSKAVRKKSTCHQCTES